jgi:hypothetical protein
MAVGTRFILFLVFIVLTVITAEPQAIVTYRLPAYIGGSITEPLPNPCLPGSEEIDGRCEDNSSPGQ